jgi:hypothetical protein
MTSRTESTHGFVLAVMAVLAGETCPEEDEDRI